MRTRFHVALNGQPAPCNARFLKCPRGNHSDNKEDAVSYSDSINEIVSNLKENATEQEIRATILELANKDKYLKNRKDRQNLDFYENILTDVTSILQHNRKTRTPKESVNRIKDYAYTLSTPISKTQDDCRKLVDDFKERYNEYIAKEIRMPIKDLTEDNVKSVGLPHKIVNKEDKTYIEFPEFTLKKEKVGSFQALYRKDIKDPISQIFSKLNYSKEHTFMYEERFDKRENLQTSPKMAKLIQEMNTNSESLASNLVDNCNHAKNELQNYIDEELKLQGIKSESKLERFLEKGSSSYTKAEYPYGNEYHTKEGLTFSFEDKKMEVSFSGLNTNPVEVLESREIFL